MSVCLHQYHSLLVLTHACANRQYDVRGGVEGVHVSQMALLCLDSDTYHMILVRPPPPAVSCSRKSK